MNAQADNLNELSFIISDFGKFVVTLKRVFMCMHILELYFHKTYLLLTGTGIENSINSRRPWHILLNGNYIPFYAIAT